MVAKITVPLSINRAVNYNEQKAKTGKATCLHASGFLKEAADLSFREKITRFQDLISLNQRASTNTVHISLNFAEGETLSKDLLTTIAVDYMDRIGFSAQPFIVYEHRDAGHPHLHIVTTNIRTNGSRISLHNLGKNASEMARKSLEQEYGLVRAERMRQKVAPAAITSLTAKAEYGKGPTKRAITNVLDTVLTQYRYSSLPELNAVLQRYQVLADRGTKESVTYKRKGLLYRIVDEKGNKVGVPIKASSIYIKPTLSYLEQRFAENRAGKEPFKKKLQAAIDWVMIKPPPSLFALQNALKQENISLVVRQNETGLIYGFTYVDHRTKCVFNGSDLGKPYSAKAMMERCGISQTQPLKKVPQQSASKRSTENRISPPPSRWNEQAAIALLDKLLNQPTQEMQVPFELQKQKKKKRKL